MDVLIGRAGPEHALKRHGDRLSRCS
jgi:hypothetical protein